jgi:hypothetical protein
LILKNANVIKTYSQILAQLKLNQEISQENDLKNKLKIKIKLQKDKMKITNSPTIKKVRRFFREKNTWRTKTLTFFMIVFILFFCRKIYFLSKKAFFFFVIYLFTDFVLKNDVKKQWQKEQS